MELNARKYISRTHPFPNRQLRNFINFQEFLEFLKYKRALEFFTNSFKVLFTSVLLEIFEMSDGLTRKTNVWLTAT